MWESPGFLTVRVVLVQHRNTCPVLSPVWMRRVMRDAIAEHVDGQSHGVAMLLWYRW